MKVDKILEDMAKEYPGATERLREAKKEHRRRRLWGLFFFFPRACFTCGGLTLAWGPPWEVLSRRHHYHHEGCLLIHCEYQEDVTDMIETDMSTGRKFSEVLREKIYTKYDKYYGLEVDEEV